MIYNIEKICKDVRICLDQNGANEVLMSEGDEETLKMDELIRSKVLEGVERVHTIAPYYMLEQGHNIDDEVFWGDQESGWVMVPDDFMRLVVFEMSDWERPVYGVITPDMAEYKKQRGRVKALRGTAQKPVVALCVRPEGRVLEFYSCKSNGAHVSKAVYVPYPTMDMYGGVDMSEKCYEAVVYTIAGLVLVSMGEVERSTAFFEMTKQYLEK